MICNRCNRDKTENNFQIKKNGQSYKSCNGCRKISFETAFPDNKIELVLFRKLLKNMDEKTQDVDVLKSRIAKLEERLAHFIELDSRGNVYLDHRPKNLFTSTELLQLYMKNKNIDCGDLFKMTILPNENVIIYNLKKERKSFLLQLGRFLSSQYKMKERYRAERTKTKRDDREVIDGRSSIGNLFPKEYVNIIPQFEAIHKLNYLTETPVV